jgi:ribosomal protein L7Ae-like RNA K-turn-binding protein
MQNKVYSFLGLAMKAGKLVSGEDTCERMLKSGKVILLIVAVDASDNTKKNFTNMCSFRKVECRFYGEKNLLGRYIGKELRSVVAVLDRGFAKRLAEIIAEEEMKVGGGHIGQ